MTKEETFLREGAFYMGQRLIYKQKDVGVNMSGHDLSLTPEGEEIFDRLNGITDVEVKPVKAKKKVETAADDAKLEDLLG